MKPSRPPILLACSRVAFSTLACALAALALFCVALQTTHAAGARSVPTIVLLHGAFAESSSWDEVIARLQGKGYSVVAAANPLRGVSSDAQYIARLVDSIPGPIVLVGHSYGGTVITNAASGKPNVKALVYVAGFAPDTGERASDLAARLPGSTLGAALEEPVPLGDGGKDLYILQSAFHEQFAADLPSANTALLAAAQRPITEAALNEPSASAAWKRIPSWFIYGTADKNIPPAPQPFMAKRAGARRIVAVDGASHLVMSSQPDAVATLIVEAAEATGD